MSASIPVVSTEPMPPLTDTQLAERIGLGLTVFYERKNAGDFAFLELKPQLPNSNTRYSRVLVSRWLAGEDLTVVASRRFFGKAGGQVLAMPARRGRRPGRPRKSVSAVHTQQSNEPGAVAPLKEVEQQRSAR